MRETLAIIERVRRVSTGLQQLELSVDASLAQLQPGQTLFAYAAQPDPWFPYLREQWIPVAAQPGHITIELDTERSYIPGQNASLLAPVGQPIPLRSGISRLLMIAEDAIPTPLVWPARSALQQSIAVTLVISGRALTYPLELFPPEVEILRGDTEWKWPDQVDTITWADQVIALAPSYAQWTSYGALYRTINQIRQQAVPDGYVCGLFYQRLACGTGACQGCQVTCRNGDLLACTDGPAIDLKVVKF